MKPLDEEAFVLEKWYYFLFIECFCRCKEMFVPQCSRVLLLNEFCCVSNRNRLNLSIKPSNNTGPKITFILQVVLYGPFIWRLSCWSWPLFLSHWLFFECLHTGHLIILTWICCNTALLLTNSNMSSTVLKPLCNLYFEPDMRKKTSKKNTNDTFYTYLNKKSDILPNIMGKHICLLYCFCLKALQHERCIMHFSKAFCQYVSHEPLCQLMNVYFLICI